MVGSVLVRAQPMPMWPQAQGHIRLVHDTFHHTLAGGGPIYPALTGLVHLSGVVADIPVDNMEDDDRVLVDAGDRLGNLTQIQALLDAGYIGAFSFECFAPAVRQMSAPEAALRQSMDFISSQMRQRAA